MVILDLEDGVSAPNRPYARQALRDHPLDPDVTIVRVNPIGTPDFEADLAAMRDTSYGKVMVAKLESSDGLAALDGREVVGLCETPRGVLAAPQIAADERVSALMWGADDLVAAIGGSSSRRVDGSYLDIAVAVRSAVLLAAAGHGKPAVDAVHLAIDDLDQLAAESDDAARSGFAAKACIHPRHVPVITAAFRPSAAEIVWAEELLARAGGLTGAFQHDGRMVDGPLIQQARRLLIRAGTPFPD